MLKRLTGLFIALSLALGANFVLSANTAQAASICKGMSGSKCDGTSACYWVKSYKTKSGSSVKAHCRAKPNGGAAKAKDTKKKSVAKKTSTSSQSTSKKSASKKTSDKKKSTSKDKATSEKKTKDTKKSTSSKKASKAKPSKKKKSTAKKKKTKKKNSAGS